MPLAGRAVTALVVLAVAGCGGGDGKRAEQQSPQEVVTAFAKAFGAGNGAKACDLLTEAAQQAFVRRAQPLTGADDCPTAIEKVAQAAGGSVTEAYASAKVEDVKVNGSKATAQLSAGGGTTTVALERDGGEWRLTGVPGL